MYPTYIEVRAFLLSFLFFFYLGFFSLTFTNHRTAREGGSISLTPHYHHPLYRHLNISRAITAESSPLHIAGSRTRTREPLVYDSKSLTTKLLKNIVNLSWIINTRCYFDAFSLISKD